MLPGGSAGDLWQNTVVTVDANGNTVTDLTLNDVTGTPTLATVSHLGFRRHNAAGQVQASTSVSPLQASVYMRHLNDNANLTIGGLLPGSSADIALFSTYHLGGIDRGTSFTIDGTTQSTTGASAGDGAAYVVGQNYVLFSGLTVDPSGEINVAISGNATNFSDFNGFQLDATPVPEPSSAVLAGLATLGLLRRRR